LDAWTEEQANVVRKVGNKNAALVWEAGCNVQKKPDMDQRQLERYIRDKYERKRFFSQRNYDLIYKGNGNVSQLQQQPQQPQQQQQFTQQQPQQQPQQNHERLSSSGKLNFMPPSKYSQTKRNYQTSTDTSSTTSSKQVSLFDLLDSKEQQYQQPQQQQYQQQPQFVQQQPQQQFKQPQQQQTQQFKQPQQQTQQVSLLDIMDSGNSGSQQKASDIIFNAQTKPQVSSSNIFDNIALSQPSPVKQQQHYDFSNERKIDYMSFYQQQPQQQQYRQQMYTGGNMYTYQQPQMGQQQMYQQQMYQQQMYQQQQMNQQFQLPQRDYSSIGKYYV